MAAARENIYAAEKFTYVKEISLKEQTNPALDEIILLGPTRTTEFKKDQRLT